MKRIVIAVLTLAAVAFAAYALGLGEHLSSVETMRRFFESLGWLGYLAFISVSIFVTIFLLPGQLLALVAGITYGGLVGGALTVIGATVGSCIAFALGRYVARDYIVQRFERQPMFQRIERGLAQHGVGFLVLTRLVPLFPFAIQSYAYALTPMRVGTFTLVSFLTMLPASFIFSCMASEVAEKGLSAEFLLALALAGVALFALSFVPWRIAKKKKIMLR